MLRISVPGREPFELLHLVSDFNGTLAVDGALLNGVAARLVQLAQQMRIHVLTAATHGRLDAAQDELRTASTGGAQVAWQRILTGADKERYVLGLGAGGVVALGNGANDELMLRAAALGIAIIGPEGASQRAAQAADILVASPLDAMDLLLHPARIVATLRP